MRSLTAASVALAVAISTGATAFAQTRTTQFAVRAQVVSYCKVTASEANFGADDSSAAARFDEQCAPGSASTISLDGGGTGNPPKGGSSRPEQRQPSGTRPCRLKCEASAVELDPH
jgi:hypothetical protein